MFKRNIILSAFFLGIIAFTLWVYLFRLGLSTHYFGNTDFFKFYQSMRFYFAGQNIYDPTIIKVENKTDITWLTANSNLNPPFVTIMLFPFYYLNYAQGLYLWVSISISLILASVWLILKIFPNFREEKWLPIAITAAFLAYMPNSANISYGQITAFCLILLVLLWITSRRGQDVAAGILLAIIFNIKIFFGLFFIFFLLERRWNTLFWASLTTALINLVGWYIFGVDAYLRYHHILNDVNWYAASWNVSFLGFFTRLFSGIESNIPIVNIPWLAQLLSTLCNFILFTYLLYAWYRSNKLPPGDLKKLNFDCGFCLAIISMLLLSPLGWIYYFPFLLIPYLYIVSLSKKLKFGTQLHIVMCFIYMLSSSIGGLLRTPEVKTNENILVSGGLGFYCLLLTLAVFVYSHKQISDATTLLSKPTIKISNNLYLLIYFIASIPSAISLFVITQGMLMR